MTLRIGCVEYINALPIHLPFQLGKIESDHTFTYGIPSHLNTLLRNREIDCALTSSVAYLEGEYHLLPGYGIVGHKEIMSVNLYTQFPLSSLSGMRVGLTHHSATSIALLKTLCQHLWKIEPNFEPLNREQPLSNYAAFLLIGDEAIEKLSIPGFQTIDLGAAWYTLTGLPFVYAVFAVRREVKGPRMALLQQELDAALRWSEANRELVEKEALKRCSLSPQLVHQYYSLLNYRLGDQEMEGLQTFNTLRKNPHVSKVRP